MSWVDILLPEYKEGRKDLSKVTIIDHTDQSKVNSMVDSMTYSIDWMETGRQPDAYRGIDKRDAYRHLEIIPDITKELRKERKELRLTSEQKKALLHLFSTFSEREEQCYVMYAAEGLSMQEIANRLGLSKWTVRTYIDRAKEKVDTIVN